MVREVVREEVKCEVGGIHIDEDTGFTETLQLPGKP